MAPKLIDASKLAQPKIVTLPELAQALAPYVAGRTWAKDTIVDLWRLGAPTPDSGCPGLFPCRDIWTCNHIKRILLPNQFAKWWADLGARLGREPNAGQALKRVRGRHW